MLQSLGSGVSLCGGPFKARLDSALTGPRSLMEAMQGLSPAPTTTGAGHDRHRHPHPAQDHAALRVAEYFENLADTTTAASLNGPESVKPAVDWEYERRRDSLPHRRRRHAGIAQPGACQRRVNTDP